MLLGSCACSWPLRLRFLAFAPTLPVHLSPCACTWPLRLCIGPMLPGPSTLRRHAVTVKRNQVEHWGDTLPLKNAIKIIFLALVLGICAYSSQSLRLYLLAFCACAFFPSRVHVCAFRPLFLAFVPLLLGLCAFCLVSAPTFLTALQPVSPNLKGLALDPMHLAIVYEYAQWRERIPGSKRPAELVEQSRPT